MVSLEDTGMLGLGRAGLRPPGTRAPLTGLPSSLGLPLGTQGTGYLPGTSCNLEDRELPPRGAAMVGVN